MYVTIESILGIEKIDGIKIIAGEGGKSNTISNVNILDNPDTFDWLVAGDLLLTTGFIFKNDLEYQKNLIQELYERGCAGLGMKLYRYFDAVPPVMVEAANRLNFPIVEIPYRYSLSDISNVVTSAIYGNMDSILKKSLSLHDTFTKVVLQGGTLSDITSTIAAITRHSVLLLDSKFRLLAYKDHSDTGARLGDLFELNLNEIVFESAILNQMPVDAAVFKKSNKIKHTLGGQERILRVVPIIAIGTTYGYLVVLEGETKLTEIDFIALEHGATVIAVERIKAKEMEEFRHRVRRDFFDDLLANNIRSINSLNNMAEIHGLNSAKKHYCMITDLNMSMNASSDDFWQENLQMGKVRNKVTKLIYSVMEQSNLKTVSIHRRNKVITFVQVDNPESRKVRNQSLELARQVVSLAMSEYRDMDIYIGIGKVYEILSLSKSFTEAQEAINMEKRLDDAAHVAHYENYMIYNLLGSELSKEKLKEFYDKTVRKLVEYDEENNTNLVDSLKVYFAHGGRISDASREMFIHRNTFIYRIDKIRTILDIDFRDSEEMLEIQLGLKIMDYLLLGKITN